MNTVAEAIRKITAAAQNAIDSGERSTAIDAHDVIELLLAIADKLDPVVYGDSPHVVTCPECNCEVSRQLSDVDPACCICPVCGIAFEPMCPAV